MSLTPPSVADVRLIITSPLTDAQIQALINDTVVLCGLCSVIEGYPSDRQAIIIKLMVAHFMTLNSGKGARTSKSLGDASEAYVAIPVTWAAGSTSYGQQALMFEPSGCLANLGRRKPVLQTLQTPRCQ